MAKKPKPSFSILFKGSGVYPEEIPWQRVSEALRAIQNLAITGEQEVDDDKSIRLIGIARGSAVFHCFAQDKDRVLNNLRLTGNMVSSGELLPDAVLRAKPIEDLSRIARSLACEVIIRKDKQNVLAKIQGDTYDNLFGSQLVSGETTIIGVVKRVGGATDLRCSIRIPSRHDLLYCDVSSIEVSRDLGRRLYEDVILMGRAKWLKTDWQIVEFKIDSIAANRDCSMTQAFRKLRAAGGNAWDNIEDPNDFLRKIRG